ncbi:MAG: Spy/CpxP family protein refolding chaperone [Xanthobacteraceae bacterium]
MKIHLVMVAGILTVLALPLTAQAQGIVRGAQEGAAEGNRAAGPVGGAVGGVVGGAVGGAVGGVKGVLGIPQRSGLRNGRDRAELSPNQITDQFAARTASIKAKLRLTPEQEKNWPGFENAMTDLGKRNADRQAAMQADRTPQNGPPDVIEQMRGEAKYLSDRSADEKVLADAAQPLYASLDKQQQQRFAKDLLGLIR